MNDPPKSFEARARRLTEGMAKPLPYNHPETRIDVLTIRIEALRAAVATKLSPSKRVAAENRLAKMREELEALRLQDRT